MKRRMHYVLAAAGVAALLMGFVACGEPKEWSEITNLADLNGTWKGSTTMTMKDLLGESSSSNPSIDNLKLAVDVTLTVANDTATMKMVMDMTDFIDKLAADEGKNSETVWKEKSPQLSSNGMTLSTSGPPYTATMETPVATADIARDTQINADKTKIKAPISSTTELILTKQ